MTDTEIEAKPKPRRAKERRHQLPAGRCGYCDAERRDGSNFFPAHDPHPHCRRAGHSHCTCDVCFR